MPGRAVAAFLRSLQFPPESTEVEGRGLATYIEEQSAIDKLTDWTVFLATGDRGAIVDVAGRKVRSIQRTPLVDRSTNTRFIVKSILNPPDEAIDEPYVPVKFHSKITELGLLELWCVSTKSDARWKLEFSVRELSEEVESLTEDAYRWDGSECSECDDKDARLDEQEDEIATLEDRVRELEAALAAAKGAA